MKQTDLAWAAGIIDGEGCIFLGWQTRSGVTYKVSVEMNHRKTVTRLHRFLGGRLYRRERTSLWTCHGTQAVRALDLVYPDLFTKKTQADCLFKLAALVETRPRGVPTPGKLRVRYQRLIDRCRELKHV